MKYLIKILIIVLIIFGLTNPSELKHKEALRNQLSEFFTESLKKTNETQEEDWQLRGLQFGISLAQITIDEFIIPNTFSDNFILFSLTKIKLNGKIKTIGIGILGKVIIFDKDEIFI
jgi:hypothetical protein